MGLQNTAHYLKSKGRGRDTELVHMTPGEIKGLRALAMAHGGDLTINPSTGLPEAGFLEDILPVVAAAGLTYLTAGAAAPMLAGTLGTTGAGIVAGAGAGALISGGMAAVQGKDVGQAALMGGIGGGFAGGMGAYGDANVFGVGAAPTDTALTAATEGVANANLASNVPITSEAASQLSSANPTQLNQLMAQQSSVVPTDVPLSQMSASEYAAAGSSRFGAPTTLPDLTSGTGVPSTSTLQESANALKTINTPVTYYDKLGSGAMDTAKKIGIQGLPALGVLQADQNMPGEQDDEYTRRLKGYKLSPNYKAYEAPRPNPYYRPTYAAEGGVMNSFDDSSGMDEPAGLAQGNLQKGLFGLGYADGGKILMPKLKSDFGIATDSDPSTRSLSALDAAELRNKKLKGRFGIKTAQAPKTGIKSLGGDFSDTAAKGGIADLGGYSDGGRMLKGPGDGMSDSIPGVIGGKQPARLADGEFVVPADVVSHLGNGSTDAGAKKLYSMMDKIRQARTGKKKQAPQVNVDKYLPMGKASGGITGYAEGGEVKRFQNEGVVESGATYSDQRILDAIKESLAQGVGLEDTKNALRTRYGVDDAQLYRVADLYNQPTTTTQTPVTPVTPTPTPPTDAQNIKTRVQDAYNKGFSSAQIGAALIRSGVSQAQALQATGLDQNTISQIYTGGAALGNADIGNPAGNFMFDVSGKPITTEQRAAADKQAAIDKFNETASTSIAAYRPSFVPRVLGINMSDAMQDPYSNTGLEALYGQMMGQYQKPTPPMSDAQIRAFAQDFANRNPGKGAELGQALINQGIPVNQAIAATGLSPGTLNTAYIGGQALGTAAPPTLNTQYNYSDPGSYYRPAPVSNLVLQNPIRDAATAEANQAKADAVAAANASTAGDAGGAGSGGERAGGLMSIDRKKRAKPKYKT